MNPIDIALRIATSAHAGQLDRDGYPVILHPLTVGLMGHTDEEKMAGFLHDVVEDTSYSFEDLLHEGISTGVVNALRILTHQSGTDYFDYVQSIIDSQNPIALQVKYNDLQHNFQRGKGYPDLQKKHGKALEMIKAAIEKCSQVDIYHAPEDSSIEVGIFACGCFWGAQHQFQKQPGVLNTLAGYTGGKEAFPSYADVRDHKTQSSWSSIPNRFHMRAYVNSSSRFTTRHRPMVLVLIWGHNTAAVSSIVMNLRSRQPDM